MNSVSLIGRLVRDPELRETSTTTVTRFTIAIDRPTKKDGSRETDFPSCIAFGQTGENIAKYFKKGQRIGITGHLATGKYTKDDGTTVYTTDIIADRYDFIEKKDDKPADGFEAIEDENVPF